MFIIGIAGGTASGKTTIVEKLEQHFGKGNLCVLSQDSYYKDNSHLSLEKRNLLNYDHPDAIDFPLLIQQIKELHQGKIIQRPEYSFLTHNRTSTTIPLQAQKIIIIEGILVFTNEVLRSLLDLKIFIDTDADERLIRRIKRDMHERGRSLNEILSRYQETLKPMHQQFIAPTKAFADIIIPYNSNNNMGLEVVKSMINQKLS